MSAVQEVSIVKRQELLHRHYLEVPADGWITDRARARAGQSNDPVHGEIELANSDGARQQYGIHRAVGGDHDAPNPGDYLSAALAACLHSTLRMIAERLEVAIIDSEVTTTARADVRGALMVDTTVPVSFQHMHCDVFLEVPAGTDERTLKVLMTSAEHCCVVFQTLRSGTKVTTDWRIDQAP
ncbi:OsmC family protein [Thiohalophilus sp.]|uniref:OsmC family protein n=1 Tax=Thiohalophilus sp. TaxID=3028392 RepID=UPI002ACE52FA|nr:OsmC family protein [Thiohalophilus sp.]MDZ7803931.1 OsmC family protein [Thiohalophilus sp.]